MINDINSEKLYEAAIDNNFLTTSQLKECGFNNYDIKNMINNSIIKRVKRGYYSFIDEDKLLKYGLNLISKQENQKAYRCFLKCFDINPKNPNVFFQVFLRSITNNDYDKTLQLYNKLSNSAIEHNIIDSNLYIYLLNMITDIPEKERNYAKFLNYYDVKIPDNVTRYDDNKRYNMIRSLIFKRKFSLALKQLINLTQDRGHSTVHDIILMALLKKAIKVEAQSRDVILNNIMNNDYQSVISYLFKKSKKYKLSLFDRAILSLSKKYLDIINTGEIPLVTINETDNIFEAIEGNNFKLALEICNRFNKENNLKDRDSLYYYILSDLTNVVDAINNEKVDNRQFQKNKSDMIKIEKTKQESEMIKKKNEDIDKLLIDKKYDELIDKRGIILLDPMNDDRIKRILELSKKYPNLSAEIIDDFGKKRIMLRFKQLIPDSIDVDNVLENCKQFYLENDYKKCIESNLKLLETLDEPTYKMYFKTGLCYLRLHQKKKAIDYITVANSVCLKNNVKNDYSDLILSLRGEISRNERKTVFNTNSDFFEDKNIDIDNFDEINNYICESGLDVNSACLQLGLSKDQIDIINLVYAKKFFELGNEEKGKLFLNHVERSKNKSDDVNKMIFEIRKKMKFYKNRKSEDTKQLKLTLKP